MSDRSKVYLKDRRTDELVEAVLIDGVIRAEVEAAEAVWRPIVEQKVAQLRQIGAPRSAWPEHSHWDWRKKHEATEGLIAYVPGPRTVYQLSTALGLPKERMLQLSGNMIVRDTRFGEEAVRFAARSESVAKLTKEEHEALEEFVKYLSETT